MPKYDLPIIAIIETLENTGCYAEALFFHEVLRFHFDEDMAIESLKANIQKIAEDSDLFDLHQRHPAGVPEIDEISITLDPPRNQKQWRKPLTLKFSIVRWSHGDAAMVAYIPAVCITVVATRPATKEALDQIIRQHIRATLARRNSMDSLGDIVWLQRERDVKVVNTAVEVPLKTPKQSQASAEQKEANKKSALAEAATDLTSEKLPVAYEMDDTVRQLAETLTGRSPRSVLLVGRSGVGKTAAVYEMVRRRQDFQLAHTPFWATNGSRLIAGMSGFGQWQERCQRLWREAAQSRAIIYLGNLIELMEVGKSASNSQGIANFLRPYIARGDVLSISECTPEQLTLIERTNPGLLGAFHQLKIEESSAERGRNILLNLILAEEGENAIEIETLERIDQLHRRYATYSAYPGRPVRFLKNLLQDRPEGKTLTPEDVTRAFSRETGLPIVLLDEREKLDLAAMREWFAGRIIGQPDAIDLIVNLLATVKAGLTRPRRPIASLLFIGPTGVGKTEMAKSLAEFLFQDRNRLTRFDMSEYADHLGVTRLIGGIGAQTGEGLLTAKVREQPFSVVLLDEFEKAHRSFFDLLLQVLGEGRLTDAMGRVADFSNAVVIMTSNLGAASFQRGLTGFGQTAASRQAAAKHFTNAVRTALRPELFNRIDRIVPFAPLDEPTVLRIAERELEQIRNRDGIRYRSATLAATEEVTRYFGRRGYDPRYGARPLKRALERELLAPLSEKLNSRRDATPLRVSLRVEEEKLVIDIQQPPAVEDERSVPSPPPAAAALVREASVLRRDAQALERSMTVRNLENEIYSRERIENRLLRRKYKSPDDLALIAQLPELRQTFRSIKDFSKLIAEIENEAALKFYRKSDADFDDLRTRLNASSTEWKDLLLRVYALGFKKPDEITLAIFGDDHHRMFEMAGTYYALAKKQHQDDSKLDVWQLTQNFAAPSRRRRGRRPEIELDRTRVEKPELYLASPRPNVLGIALSIRSPMAFLRFESERGLHTFTIEKKSARCIVDASDAAIEKYVPPRDFVQHDAIRRQEKRRNYNIDQSLIDDLLLDRKQHWSGHLTVDLMKGFIEDSLMVKVKKMIED